MMKGMFGCFVVVYYVFARTGTWDMGKYGIVFFEKVKIIAKDVMEEAGIEPATCRMRSDHSAPELHPLQNRSYHTVEGNRTPDLSCVKAAS